MRFYVFSNPDSTIIKQGIDQVRSNKQIERVVIRSSLNDKAADILSNFTYVEGMHVRCLDLDACQNMTTENARAVVAQIKKTINISYIRITCFDEDNKKKLMPIFSELMTDYGRKVEFLQPSDAKEKKKPAEVCRDDQQERAFKKPKTTSTKSRWYSFSLLASMAEDELLAAASVKRADLPVSNDFLSSDTVMDVDNDDVLEAGDESIHTMQVMFQEPLTKLPPIEELIFDFQITPVPLR